MSEKEIMEALEGVWIFEIAELDGYSRAENSRITSIISRTEDRGRPAFCPVQRGLASPMRVRGNDERRVIPENTTGNRRFLPVKTGQINLEPLRRDRDQLMAEAAHLEAQGYPNSLPEELWNAARNTQQERMQEDPVLDILERVRRTVADGEERIHTEELFAKDYLDLPASQRKPYHLKQIAMTMRELGWDGPKKLRIHGVIAGGYSRPSDLPDDPSF